MDVMDVVGPIALFIGVIVAAAAIYALGAAIKARFGRSDDGRRGSHMR